jgi:hypothetical protein
MIVAVLARLALNILGSFRHGCEAEGIGRAGASPRRMDRACAKDLKANPGKSLVMAGYRLPLAAHLLVVAMNEALGAVNHTVEFHQTQAAKEGTLAELAARSMPARCKRWSFWAAIPPTTRRLDLNWPQAQAKAKTVVRLGYYEDETSWNAGHARRFQWDLPMAHFLESWGDARTADGTLVPIQPLDRAVVRRLTELEVLALIGGLTPSPLRNCPRNLPRHRRGRRE